MLVIKTRKSTFIFLATNIVLDFLIILITLIILASDLMDKSLLVTYLIINIAEILYIIYRFFNIVEISCCFLFIKYLVFLFNWADIAVVLSYIYVDQENHKDLSNKQARVYSFYLFLFISKAFTQLFSRCRFGRFGSMNENNKSGIIINEEKGREAFGPSEKINELNKLKKENLLLRKENQNLKGNTVNLIDDFFKQKKTEIICQYIKSNFNKDINPKELQHRLFLEIRNSGLFIDKQKYEEIFAYYIKVSFMNYLKCPITGKILNDPVITPDGQTFERKAILEKIEQVEENPITKNVLNKNDLIQNILVLKISEILIFNGNKFNLQHFDEIKKLLTSEKTKKLYEHPYVISDGNDKGKTEEKTSFLATDKYQNLIIMNLIYSNLVIFDNRFKEFDIELGQDYNSRRSVNTNNNYNTNMINSEDIHMIKK